MKLFLQISHDFLKLHIIKIFKEIYIKVLKAKLHYRNSYPYIIEKTLQTLLTLYKSSLGKISTYLRDRGCN